MQAPSLGSEPRVLCRSSRFMIPWLARLVTACVVRGAALQPALEFLHRVNLLAMNYGGYAHPVASGERIAFRYAARVSAGRRPHVFDVGANVGSYAEEALRYFSGSVTLDCFEPTRCAFVELSRRLGTRDNVALHRLALSDTDGEARIYSDHEASELASLYPRNLDQNGVRADRAGNDHHSPTRHRLCRAPLTAYRPPQTGRGRAPATVAARCRRSPAVRRETAYPFQFGELLLPPIYFRTSWSPPPATPYPKTERPAPSPQTRPGKFPPPTPRNGER